MATSELYINLSVDGKGNLLVHDTSDYAAEDSIYEFSLYEALFDCDLTVIGTKITPIERIPVPYARHGETYDFPFDEWTTPFRLPKDGEHYYMKLLLPKREHVTGEYNQYYVDNNAVYYGTDTCPGSTPVNAEALYRAAFEENKPGFDEASVFFAPFFSIAYLNQSLLLIEKEMLDNYNCKQNGRCNTNKELSFQRDLLLDAHRVLLWLISEKNFDEATKILNRVTSCGLASYKNAITYDTGGCGCRKSL